MLFFGTVALYFVTPSILRRLAEMPPDPDNKTTADGLPSRLKVSIAVIGVIVVGFVVLHLTCGGLAGHM